MTINELKKYKKILIIGYGVEGKATHAFLKKHFPEAIIDVVDASDGEDYLEDQQDYELAIKSPGVRPELVTIPYTTATNIFFANAKGKTIGVTGTKGKSTTATLIYEMLKKDKKEVYLGGNIGKPAIEVLDTLTDHSWTVLELSSFQLQDIKYSPHIAVMLMLTSEHLDYHPNVESYIEAKRNLLRFQKQTDFAVLNRDYPVTNESDLYTDAQLFYVSRERETNNACYTLSGAIYVKKNETEDEIIATKDVALPGAHNLENVCAAIMAARLAEVSTKYIIEVLKTFYGLPHRLEYVGEKQGIRFYNDSLATVPEATIGALDAFAGEVETLIAGGHDRGVDYNELGQYLVTSGVRTTILFPTTGEKIWEAIVTAGGEKKIKKLDVHSMHEAIVYALDETNSGKICLLSPAAPSFGVFKNYKDRGDQFKKEVMGLA
ncbi:MAG: UDP-N-acetylmuramoyl-L-alanine--D-glutamate ligase [Patescibacteria group bacterium]